ncbi:MAG TPA: helix-turn-helix domain-containing protein [Actinophytocola sp.]|jgi:predicted ArsR family transcriptional regulator|uniref:ArsR/SmtB family transcription factor n=1 Tax=Actinophytocola sp. TaxID=1872138 RepID=UPI002F95BF0E
MAEDMRDITDPKALRAMAHPLRWQLLEILSREGTATATQCAQETGESVANCSYHLNLLARYDYVEKAEGGQGREKPWRLVNQSQRFGAEGSSDEETRLAAQAASIAFLDYQFAMIKDRNLRSGSLPAEWQAATGIDNTHDFMTPAEVEEIHREVRKLMDRFRDRRTDPAKRPEGARSVNLFFSTMVKPD